MEKLYQKYLEQIPAQDWEKTPASVKKLLEEMVQRIENLEKSQAEVLALHQQLLEQVNRTSKNSSSPPSQDPPGFEKKPKKQKTRKKRGGQPGHDGHSRDLYPIEKCSDVIEHHPTTCSCCGESLRGEDKNPYRHPGLFHSKKKKFKGLCFPLNTGEISQTKIVFEVSEP